MTKIIMITSAIVTALLLAPTGKSQTLGDANFEPNSDALQAAPANLAVVRPTHFPGHPGKIKHRHDNDSLTRAVGRNVSFRDLIAEACDCSPGCVVLPNDAPRGGFDFLVTYSASTRKHLRQAIEQELGFIATAQQSTTEVQYLQVQDSALPGLAVNNQGDSDIRFRDGTLYFIHQPINLIVKGLEDGLGQPVIDQTSLTNFYDFSVGWTAKTTQAMREGAFHLEGVQKVLSGWGLKLTPGRTNMEMFVVKKTR